MDTETKIVEAVEEASRPASNIITLSTGVALVGRKANPLTLIKVMASFPRPKPPVVFIKVMGREMENPDDPDYIDRVKAWKAESGAAMLNAMILLGTSLRSVPKGYPGPDDQSWVDEYVLLNLPLNLENKSWRYLTWIQFKACADEMDLKIIQDVVGRLSGIREADVKAASAFPGRDDGNG